MIELHPWRSLAAAAMIGVPAVLLLLSLRPRSIEVFSRKAQTIMLRSLSVATGASCALGLAAWTVERDQLVVGCFVLVSTFGLMFVAIFLMA